MLFLLSLCFFAGNLGVFASESNHLVGCLLIFVTLVMVFSSLPKLAGIRSSGRQLLALVSIASALVVLVIAKPPLLWIAAACLFAFGLRAWFEGEASARCTILGLTAALYLVLLTFLYPLEPFWQLNLKGAVSATRKLGAVVDHPLTVGPAASGWWICLLFACYFLAMFVIEKRLWRLTLGVVSVLAVFAVFNLINLHYPLLRYHTHTGLNLFNSQILCFALGAGVLYFFHRKMRISEVVENQPKLKFILSVQVLVILAVVGHHLAANGVGQNGDGSRVIIFGTEPSASYGTPSFDRLGVGSSGMYGLLPKYLGAAGFEVTIVEQTEKLNEMLDQTRILTVISPTEIFSPPLHQRIWKFVETGGSLLVMGDHTDIFGTMRPLNYLLAPVNISFNFDSAYPARKAWRYSYEYFPHPTTKSLDQVNDVLQYGTGASLSLSTPAYPVIIGAFAFSDKGNYANTGRGAFLGDYAYQRDEQLGDVVLVAGAKYGHGKVLVFGDTSSFQNVSLPYSYPLIVDAFTWLSTREVLSYPTLSYLSFVFIALAVLALILGRQVNQPIAMTITALTLTLGLCVSTEISPSARVPHKIPERSHHVAYVDASHVGYFKLEHWEDESIDGLLVNLSRNGYLPAVTREFSEDWLKASEIYVSISPLQPYSRDEIEALEKFVAEGGIALLAVGYEESAASGKLLAQLGFRIGSVPLGAAPITDFIPTPVAFQKIMQEPHFMEAWPVEATDGAVHEVLYSYKDFPIVVSKSQGRGKIVVIGDTRFLYDKTLENEKGAWPGNVEFVKKILSFKNHRQDAMGAKTNGFSPVVSQRPL
jgi:hypothetical protein